MMSSWLLRKSDVVAARGTGQPKVVATSMLNRSLPASLSLYTRYSRLAHTQTVSFTALYFAPSFTVISSQPFGCMLRLASSCLSPPAQRSLPAMLATSTRPAVAGSNGKAAYHTVTALKRWSCDDKELPPVPEIKSIHIYDFDNTCRVTAALQNCTCSRLQYSQVPYRTNNYGTARRLANSARLICSLTADGGTMRVYWQPLGRA